MNHEMYEEQGVAKRSRLTQVDQLSPPRKLTAQEMINILLKMGYELKKIDRGACG
ncbi:MAG: hypothetical protein ABR985_07165 [Methanotrichaceae archaeon]|jgi:hypothetical protein